MNIEAARQYYKESTSNRKMLEGIFTKEELEIESETFLKVKQCPSQEEFNKFFEEEILSQVDPSKTRFPIENSFSCIHLCNSRGEWLFDYDTDPKNSYFYYQFKCVYAIIMNKFSLQDDELQALMKSLVESHFKMKGITPLGTLQYKIS